MAISIISCIAKRDRDGAIDDRVASPIHQSDVQEVYRFNDEEDDFSIEMMIWLDYDEYFFLYFCWRISAILDA